MGLFENQSFQTALLILVFDSAVEKPAISQNR